MTIYSLTPVSLRSFRTERKINPKSEMTRSTTEAA